MDGFLFLYRCCVHLLLENPFRLASTNSNFFFCSNRAEEMNNSQLTELEDDIQQQLRRTEERVRDEVSVIPAVFIVDDCSCD